MASKAKIQESLTKVLELLKDGKTVKDVSEMMSMSVPTAYLRVNTLIADGKIAENEVVKGKRGRKRQTEQAIEGTATVEIQPEEPEAEEAEVVSEETESFESVGPSDADLELESEVLETEEEETTEVAVIEDPEPSADSDGEEADEVLEEENFEFDYSAVEQIREIVQEENEKVLTTLLDAISCLGKAISSKAPQVEETKDVEEDQFDEFYLFDREQDEDSDFNQDVAKVETHLRKIYNRELSLSDRQDLFPRYPVVIDACLENKVRPTMKRLRISAMEASIIIQTEIAQKLILDGNKDYDRFASIYNVPIELVYAVSKIRMKQVVRSEA